jgi:hypothetical protein
VPHEGDGLYRFFVLVHIPNDEQVLHRFSVVTTYPKIEELLHQLPSHLFGGIVVSWHDGWRARRRVTREVTFHMDGRCMMELRDV